MHEGCNDAQEIFVCISHPLAHDCRSQCILVSTHAGLAGLITFPHSGSFSSLCAEGKERDCVLDMQYSLGMIRGWNIYCKQCIKRCAAVAIHLLRLSPIPEQHAECCS